mgnify:CR=1 FL=1
MPIPNEIPVGARIVVRTLEGVDPTDHRMKFRDYVGHVRSWDGQKLEMTRDARADSSSVRCQSFSGIDSSTVAQCSAYSGCLLAAL